MWLNDVCLCMHVRDCVDQIVFVYFEWQKEESTHNVTVGIDMAADHMHEYTLSTRSMLRRKITSVARNRDSAGCIRANTLHSCEMCAVFIVNVVSSARLLRFIWSLFEIRLKIKSKCILNCSDNDGGSHPVLLYLNVLHVFDNKFEIMIIVNKSSNDMTAITSTKQFEYRIKNHGRILSHMASRGMLINTIKIKYCTAIPITAIYDYTVCMHTAC